MPRGLLYCSAAEWLTSTAKSMGKEGAKFVCREEEGASEREHTNCDGDEEESMCEAFC